MEVHTRWASSLCISPGMIKIELVSLLLQVPDSNRGTRTADCSPEIMQTWRTLGKIAELRNKFQEFCVCFRWGRWLLLKMSGARFCWQQITVLLEAFCLNVREPAAFNLQGVVSLCTCARVHRIFFFTSVGVFITNYHEKRSPKMELQNNSLVLLQMTCDLRRTTVVFQPGERFMQWEENSFSTKGFLGWECFFVLFCSVFWRKHIWHERWQ